MSASLAYRVRLMRSAGAARVLVRPVEGGRPPRPRRALLFRPSKALLDLWSATIRLPLEGLLASNETEAMALLVHAHRSGKPVEFAIVNASGLGEREVPFLPSMPHVPAAALFETLGREKALALLEGDFLLVLEPRSEDALATLVERLQRSRLHGPAIARFGKEHGLAIRELLVLQEAVEGLGDKEIASALRLAPGTLSTYWTRIFNRTGLRSQREVLAAMVRLAAEGRA